MALFPSFPSPLCTRIQLLPMTKESYLNNSHLFINLILWCEDQILSFLSLLFKFTPSFILINIFFFIFNYDDVNGICMFLSKHITHLQHQCIVLNCLFICEKIHHGCAHIYDVFQISNQLVSRYCYHTIWTQRGFIKNILLLIMYWYI